MNNTLLVLIPKVDQPEIVSQFRPIALCNVLYKGVTKLIVNRLKPLMNKLVSPFQTSFMPKISIKDSIIIAKEMVHTMNRMQGRKEFMAIKIDLEKAYDRMAWSYMEKALEEVGLGEHIRKVIHSCISTTRMAIMWNGEKREQFTPGRGLRQGDPLPPYLFLYWE